MSIAIPSREASTYYRPKGYTGAEDGNPNYGVAWTYRKGLEIWTDAEVDAAHHAFLSALAQFSDDPELDSPDDWRIEGTRSNGHQPSYSYYAYVEFIGRCLEPANLYGSPNMDRQKALEKFSVVGRPSVYIGPLKGSTPETLTAEKSAASSADLRSAKQGMSVSIWRNATDMVRRHSGSAFPTLTDEEIDLCMQLWDRRMETILTRRHANFLRAFHMFSPNPTEAYPRDWIDETDQSTHSYAAYCDLITRCLCEETRVAMERHTDYSGRYAFHRNSGGLLPRLTQQQSEMIRRLWDTRTQYILEREGQEALTNLKDVYFQLQDMQLDLLYIIEKKDKLLEQKLETEGLNTQHENHIITALNRVAVVYGKWEEGILPVADPYENPFAIHPIEPIDPAKAQQIALSRNMRSIASSYYWSINERLRESVIALSDVLHPGELRLLDGMRNNNLWSTDAVFNNIDAISDDTIGIFGAAVNHGCPPIADRFNFAYAAYINNRPECYEELVRNSHADYVARKERSKVKEIQDFLQTPMPSVIVEAEQIYKFRQRVEGCFWLLHEHAAIVRSAKDLGIGVRPCDWSPEHDDVLSVAVSRPIRVIPPRYRKLPEISCV